MKPAGAAPQPAPKPEHARKKMIIPEIAKLNQRIAALTLKLTKLRAEIISAKLLAVPNDVLIRNPVIAGTKKFLASKERNYNARTQELANKKERLHELLDELNRY